VPWTFERSGPLANVAADGEYYYAQIAQGIHSDGQMFEVLDVLARQVGIKAIFSDWSATVTYYANCFGLDYGNKPELIDRVKIILNLMDALRKYSQEDLINKCVEENYIKKHMSKKA